MIYGIGTDITNVSRFEKWVNDENLLNRFFNEKEIFNKGTFRSKCEHYAARFAAKEAFSKALGTGIIFDLKDVYIQKNEEGKPDLCFSEEVLSLIKKRCGEAKVFVSLSHEKEYATAFVVIEKIEEKR